MKNRYDDIIELSRPASPRHTPMPLSSRAAQFSPFAALSGYEAAIREAERLTSERHELDACAAEALDERLRLLAEHLEDCPEAVITFFEPDKIKSGGAYVSVAGRVEHIDEYERSIRLDNGRRIPIDSICEIEAALFSELDYE